MSPETPGQADDREREQLRAAFRGFLVGQGYDAEDHGNFDQDEMELAFETGWYVGQAAIAAQQPQPASASQAHRLAEQQGGPPNDAIDLQELKPAPELAAAMAETRQLREGMHRLAGIWEASAGKSEAASEKLRTRPNGRAAAWTALEEQAQTHRNCATAVRELAGPQP